MKTFDVLFICQANIGRSQMAEGFFNYYTRSQKAYSAGIEDKGQKYNFMPAPAIVETMKELGIDISQQKVKQVTKELVDTAKIIYVLCDPLTCENYPSYLINNEKVHIHIIQDPYKQEQSKVNSIRDQIKFFIKNIYQ